MWRLCRGFAPAIVTTKASATGTSGRKARGSLKTSLYVGDALYFLASISSLLVGFERLRESIPKLDALKSRRKIQ